MTRNDLLALIGETGAYGSDVPNDDATTDLLSQLMDDGLIKSEPTVHDDYFWLTPKGRCAALVGREQGPA